MDWLKKVWAFLSTPWGQPLVLLAFLALSVPLFFTSAPGWWFGTAIGFAGLAWFRSTEAFAIAHRFLTQNFWGKILGELLLVAAIVGIAVAIVPEAAVGRRPVDHDHPVHFFRAWQLWEDFLSQGQLRGWSDRWYAGYPAQYLYPIGGDLWVLATWALSFGKATLSQAYGFGFFLFWVAKGVGSYALGRVLGGRFVGLLVAVLMLTDDGSFRMGGWDFAANWGVWPQSLSVAVSMFSVALLPWVMFGKRWLPVAAFGLISGFAMVAHPLQLPHFVMLAAVAAFAAILTKDEGRVRGIGRLAIGLVISGLVCAFDILPFIAVKDTAESVGTPWKTATELGLMAVEGDLFLGTLTLVSVLGIVGIAKLLRDREFLPVYVGLMATITMVAASTDLMADLRLFEISRSFEFLQYQRFAMLAKPYWFVAAACAVVAAVRGREGGPSAKSWVAIAFVVGLLGAPIMGGMVRGLITTRIERNLIEVEDRPNRQALEEFAAWAHTNLPKDGFYRVAWQAGRHDHSYVDVGTMVDAPIYKVGYTPAENFHYKLESSNLAVLNAANVRYLVTKRKMRRGYKELTKVGGFYVYEIEEPAPFGQVIEGTGEVELISYTREHFVLEAKEGSNGKMRVPISNFPYWQATRDGKPIKITTEVMKQDDKSGFMNVDLAPGRYEFKFVQSTTDDVSDLMLVFGLLLALLLVVLDHPKLRREWPRLHKVLAISEKALWPAVAVALVGASAAVVWLGTREIAVQKGKDVVFDFTQNLRKAKVTRDGRKCVWYIDSFSCDSKSWAVVESTAVVYQDNEFERCIWAVPGDRRPTIVRFRDVDLAGATSLVGYYGVASGHRGDDVDFTIKVNGAPVYEEIAKKDAHRYDYEVDLPSGAKDIEFSVFTKDHAGRHFCFQAQAVR